MDRNSGNAASKRIKTRSLGSKGRADNGTEASKDFYAVPSVPARDGMFSSGGVNGLSWQAQDGDEEDIVDQGEGGHKGRGCRCGRTKCLKQYCQCFRNDIRCTPECLCSNCHNDGHHEDIRMSAVRHIRMNNPEAFKGTSLEVTNMEVHTPRGSVHTVRGCRCRRSKCQKKYCECFSAGLACTVNCVCNDCENGNVASSPSRAHADHTEEGFADELPNQGADQWQGAGKQGLVTQSPYNFPSLASGFEAAHVSQYQQPFEENTRITSDRQVGNKRLHHETQNTGLESYSGDNSQAGYRPAQLINARPPLPTSNSVKDAPPTSGGKMNARKKPTISVQVPVAAFSKQPVIPISEPADNAASSEADSYQRQGVNSNNGGISATLQSQPSPANFDFSAKGLDFDSSLFSASSDGGGGLNGVQRTVSDISLLGTLGGSWTPRSANQAPSPRGSAFPSAQNCSAYPGWSPRDGLRSSTRRSAGVSCPPPWASAGPPLSASGGSAMGAGSSGLGDGSGMEPMPSPATRSRSGLALHRTTPPTSPATWTDPMGDPFQDPDDIIPPPLSGRAWVHRDLN